HGDAEPAGLGHRLVEGARKPAFAVALEPVLRAEAGAEAGHRLADLLLRLAEGEVHSATCALRSASGSARRLIAFGGHAGGDDVLRPVAGRERHLVAV